MAPDAKLSLSNYTVASKRLLATAQGAADAARHATVTPLHLLAELLLARAEAFEAEGLNPKDILERVEKRIAITPVSTEPAFLDAVLLSILQLAEVHARAPGAVGPGVTTEHLARALLELSPAKAFVGGFDAARFREPSEPPPTAVASFNSANENTELYRGGQVLREATSRIRDRLGNVGDGHARARRLFERIVFHLTGASALPELEVLRDGETHLTLRRTGQDGSVDLKWDLQREVAVMVTQTRRDAAAQLSLYGFDPPTASWLRSDRAATLFDDLGAALSKLYPEVQTE